MNVNASGKARVGMSSLSSSIKSVIGAYVGFESLKTAVDWSDEITLTQGKLAQLTDDVEGFLDKTYQMSQNTRTSYMDNASQMAKMWQLTGGTNGIYPGGAGGGGFNVTIDSTVIGGVGTNGVAFGGHTEGGKISFERKFNPMDYKTVTPYTENNNTPDEITPPMPWRYDNTLFKIGVGDVTGVITNFHTATNL